MKIALSSISYIWVNDACRATIYWSDVMGEIDYLSISEVVDTGGQVKLQ